jgi:hypothetical protein
MAQLSRGMRRDPLLLALFALDLALPALSFALPDQAWLTPALGRAPDGNPTSIFAAAQALLASFLFLRQAARAAAASAERLRLAAFGAGLALLAALLAVDLLSLLGEDILPQGTPLVWKLCLHAPALSAALALLFAAQPHLPHRGRARAALEAAAACAWIAALLGLLASAFEESPTLSFATPIGLVALVGTTFLVAAGTVKDSLRTSV